MTTWEYKFVNSAQIGATLPTKPRRWFRLEDPGHATHEDIEAYLNQLGREGWELVSAHWDEEAENFQGVLKRPGR